MICKYCKSDLPEDQFGIANIINGKVYRRLKCKRCKQDRQNERRKAIREWLVEYKKTQKCARCPVSDHRVLQFHHTDSGNKEFTIASMVQRGGSLKKLQEEISKCEVLCANCHAIEHYSE
jgi:late competence protein required for DNA uptake (superfamily II DNA/RNA helicase)